MIGRCGAVRCEAPPHRCPTTLPVMVSPEDFAVAHKTEECPLFVDVRWILCVVEPENRSVLHAREDFQVEKGAKYGVQLQKAG